jgi:hypothetical protein
MKILFNKITGDFAIKITTTLIDITYDAKNKERI